jgi:hypothetical protein
MSFDGPPYLSDDEIRLIGDWIAAGAPDDAGSWAPVPAGAGVRGAVTTDGRVRATQTRAR